MRQAVTGGAAFGSRRKVPEGRAERLGLAEVEPTASTALALPFRFLQLGDSRRVGGGLQGRIGGLGAGPQLVPRSRLSRAWALRWRL